MDKIANFISGEKVRTLLVSIVILIVLGIAGAGLFLIFGKADAAKKAEILVEMTKALLQLSLIIIIGGFVTFLFESFEKRRKGANSLHAYREEFLKALQTNYQAVMKSQHLLISAGLTNKFNALPATMNEYQVEVYQQEMEEINKAQLALENLKLEINNFPNAFSEGRNLEISIRKMRNYLRSLIKEYQEYYPKLRIESSNVKLEGFEKLIDFTSSPVESKLVDEFLRNYHLALGFIRQGLLPIRRAKSE